MGKTSIEWTRGEDGTPGATWNPLRAENILTGKVGWFCEHVSAGCGDSTGGGCYAEKMNVNTYFGNGLPYKASSLPHLNLFLDEKMLLKPLSWRKPRKIFVCSMTDLFGRFVKDEQIDKIFAVMALSSQRTFQILTKRPERMRDYLSSKASPLDSSRADIVLEQAAHIGKLVWDARGNESYKYPAGASVSNRKPAPSWPLPNVWLGVSVEDQKTADERIPLLLETPAAIRWISAEPLLGPIYLNGGMRRLEPAPHVKALISRRDRRKDLTTGAEFYLGRLVGLDWVVCGGESGPKARPMHPDWARSIRDQCQAAGVAFLYKQWGEWAESAPNDNPEKIVIAYDGCLMKYDGEVLKRMHDRFTACQRPVNLTMMYKVGKKKAGRLLDGRTWDEFP